ncbi:MAG: hypothetical protein H6722_28465 [Sandaracinus sp.]|nr:hypothetical protein [Myxococcales bacterium]MCB9616388.1 hypothetical protein [Sandaracinus sp.]
MTRTALPLFAFLLLACGGAQRPVDRGPVTSERLYPMSEGSVWTYDVATGVGPDVLAISRVVAIRGTSVEIRNDGGQSLTYERRAEGIFEPASSSWLLHDPIEVGATWDAGAGRTARISATDERVDVMAGVFESCVRVEETGGEDGRLIATVYCPDVGPVIIESRMTAQLTGMEASVRGTLRAFALGDEAASYSGADGVDVEEP